jgi:hypothetical protein
LWRYSGNVLDSATVYPENAGAMISVQEQQERRGTVSNRLRTLGAFWELPVLPWCWCIHVQIGDIRR